MSALAKHKLAEIEEGRIWRYEDYYALDDDKRYEVLKGELIMTPAPSTNHQKFSRNLEYIIWEYVREKELGEVFYSPFDVILDEQNVVQPDIVFISNANIKHLQDRGCFGTPDMVIEIVSISSVVRDTITKREIYEQFGVKEYWIVYPEERVIEILNLEKDKYKRRCFVEKEGIVESKVIDGLKIDLKDVFG